MGLYGPISIIKPYMMSWHGPTPIVELDPMDFKGLGHKVSSSVFPLMNLWVHKFEI